MDSSSVRAASRCATVLGVFEPPRGKASTSEGWRGPNRAPAQNVPKRRTSAARMMRARWDVLTAVMVVVPSDPLDDHSIRKISKQVTAPSGGGGAWWRELGPGGGFPRERRNSRFSRWRDAVFPRREAGGRCGGELHPR